MTPDQLVKTLKEIIDSNEYMFKKVIILGKILEAEEKES